MDLEATIVERLQELRKWQIEQQEKLLKQQHEQRELLSIEQERMYEALGLKEIVSNDSILEASSPRPKVCHSPPSSPMKDQKSQHLERDSTCNNDERQLQQLNVPTLSLSSSNSFTMNSPRRSATGTSDLDCDSDVEKIGTPRKFKVSSNVSVEGIEPLPIENKPLRRSLAIDDLPVPSPKKDFKTLLEERLRDSEAQENVNEQKKVTKKPFLRKGEGLARFKPPTNKSSIRPRSASLSAMGYTNPKSSKSKETPKTSKTTHSSRRSVPSIPLVSQPKLNLKSVPPPKKKVRSKSLSAAQSSPPKSPKVPDKIGGSDESNPSDLDSSKQETKMFEYLEEKAENSSFCSTSSAVLAFMQQSTPLKLRSIKQKLSTQTSSPSRTHQNQGSPVRAIRETVVKKDIVFSKWDSGPFDDRTVNLQNDLKQIIGSQQTNTKILLYQNNNNIEKSNVNDVFDISCSTVSSMIDDKVDDNCDNNKEANVSMHVRFSEYNEYKTIGLTDTSMLSTESQSENYRDEKEWSEHSASSESSDVEANSQKHPETIAELSQTDYSRIRYPSKPLLPATMQPRNLNDYDDSTDQSTDDEHSVLNDTDGTYYDEDNTITELQEAVRRTMESYNAKVGELSKSEDKTPTEEDYKFSEPKKKEEPTFLNSDLLKTRLLELEREIDIFRKENTALANQREKLREERRLLLKEFKEKSDSLEKDRTRMENGFQEEKKRLAREKAALENRLRDAREKSIQTKQERQEVQVLKEQLGDLQDEMSEKELRWQAAQARQKSQMRVLQMENAKLKQELEKLQAARRGNAKLKRPCTLSNTKAIHQINKQLDGKRKSLTKATPVSEDEEILPRSQSERIPSNVDDLKSDTGRAIVYEPQKVGQTEEDIAKKRNMYQELLKEATVFKDDVFKKNLENLENEKVWQKENTRISESVKERLSDPPVQASPQLSKELKHEVLKSTENIDELGGRGSYQQFVREVINPRIEPKLVNAESVDHRQSFTGHRQGLQVADKQDASSPGISRFGRFAGESERNVLDGGSLTRGDQLRISANESEMTPRKQHQNPLVKPLDSMTPRADAVSISHLSDLSTLPTQGKQQVREVQHPDGYTEYWYPNGNVKKVYPDRNITKLIYYNGDVRETTEEGCIKYFYAATKTWHTTYPDGFEILEFPDGQEERRTTDGVVEVSFPDGSIRLMQPDGIEKWALSDGTIAETFPNGEKILSLPNGQREIHTKEHKRREYPDGTVKYVYPDGTQETRYANGRIRVKDKDGVLIMDSHQA